MNGIKIRHATSKDVTVLFDLIMAIAKHHNQEAYVLTDKDELLKEGFGEAPKFYVLLAEYEKEIAGYLSYTWNYSIWNGKNYMNLDDLFVKEKFRGLKIGQELIQRAKSLCANESSGLMRREVEKDNHKAIQFYNRLGAKMVEKGIFRWI
ncbi:GNAT family N-acetyltransferase [Flagellimonas lutaonensis]|uniref:Acetyltransferase n=1 Tax=Flagellimonas lutaonensis TaxID=516051 RepID=A0A0D5YSY3_9FLAO|nr:GNAT family N-acetyltransferase [Allomuricauda lutaonensis]AKA35370.1 acetyltransferase [Allomuricauda lutaonensis]